MWSDAAVLTGWAVKLFMIRGKNKDQSGSYPADTTESVVSLSLELILRCGLGINRDDSRPKQRKKIKATYTQPTPQNRGFRYY